MISTLYVKGDAGDYSHPALAAARARDAGNGEATTTDLSDMGPVTLRREGGGILVVSNPPWGKRIGGEDSGSGGGGGSGGFSGSDQRSRGGAGGDARYSDDGSFGGGDVNFDTRGRDGFQADADWDETVPTVPGGSDGKNWDCATALSLLVQRHPATNVITRNMC